MLGSLSAVFLAFWRCFTASLISDVQKALNFLRLPCGTVFFAAACCAAYRQVELFDRLVLVDIFKLNISFFSICFPVCVFKIPKGFPLGTGPFLLTKIYGSQYREMIAAYVIHYFDICFVVDIG